MNSSELERGDEGADHASVCFSGRCSHWTERETNQASMVGGGSGCGGGWTRGRAAGSFGHRNEPERRRPRAWQTDAGRRFVDEARVRDFWGGGDSNATGMAAKRKSVQPKVVTIINSAL